MKCEVKAEVKHGCCSPEAEMTLTGGSRALPMLDHTSTSNIPHSSLITLGNEERKAIEARILQVEQKKAMAIANARRMTYL